MRLIGLEEQEQRLRKNGRFAMAIGAAGRIVSGCLEGFA
jgi:hypothetical protein